MAEANHTNTQAFIQSTGLHFTTWHVKFWRILLVLTSLVRHRNPAHFLPLYLFLSLCLCSSVSPFISLCLLLPLLYICFLTQRPFLSCPLPLLTTQYLPFHLPAFSLVSLFLFLFLSCPVISFFFSFYFLSFPLFCVSFFFTVLFKKTLPRSGQLYHNLS